MSPKSSHQKKISVNSLPYFSHSSSDVSSQAEIGTGTEIWHQAQVREGARIGRNCIIGKGVYIDTDVSVGDNCKLQNGVYIYHPAALGDGVFMGPGAIVTNDRIPRAVNQDMSLKTDADWEARMVTIGRGASIGAGSVILPGIHIAEWAMVGAGSVVTKDVASQALVLGNPARISGYVCTCGRRLKEIDDSVFCCSHCDLTYNDLKP